MENEWKPIFYLGLAVMQYSGLTFTRYCSLGEAPASSSHILGVYRGLFALPSDADTFEGLEFKL